MLIVRRWGAGLLAFSLACGGDAGGSGDMNVPADAGEDAADGAGGYVVAPGWPELEDGTVTGQVSGVALAGGEVVVFQRADQPWLGEAPGPIIGKPTLFWLGQERGELRTRAGAGVFTIPHGLRRAPNGNLWVTDVGTHKVHELSKSGELLRSLGSGLAGNGHDSFDMPTDVYVAPDGFIYVADGYGNHRVVKFTPEGEYVLEWGGAGSAPGRLETPHSIAADAAGRIYVADRGNARIQRFDTEGNLIDVFQSAELGRPWAVTVAADGFVYVVDGGDQLPEPPDRAGVVKLDQDGHVLLRWSEFGDGAGQLDWPHCIAVGDDGAVYVGEVRGGSRIQKFVAR